MTANSQVRGRYPARGLLVTAALLAVASGIAVGCGWTTPDRIRAIEFAATVSLAGAIGAWFVGIWPATTPSARVTASLAAVALRIFPALVALAWLQVAGADLRAAGAGELLVIFYLTALAAEVIRTIMNRSQTG
ncbi:MAG: hypothetical protein K8S94_07310 [Planctomycetia bacterium]|nr:hypothetical protein [Planctomycetia bacterium]